MNLQDRVNKFERGVSLGDVFLKNKTEDRYVKLVFNVCDDQRDIFVYEIISVNVLEDIELEDGRVLSKGSKVYVEKNDETPTIYGHSLPVDKLLTKLGKEYVEVEDNVQYVSNLEDDWELLEDLLRF